MLILVLLFSLGEGKLRSKRQIQHLHIVCACFRCNSRMELLQQRQYDCKACNICSLVFTVKSVPLCFIPSHSTPPPTMVRSATKLQVAEAAPCLPVHISLFFYSNRTLSHFQSARDCLEHKLHFPDSVAITCSHVTESWPVRFNLKCFMQLLERILIGLPFPTSQC